MTGVQTCALPISKFIVFVAKVSCIIALFQVLIINFTTNELMLQIAGIKSRYAFSISNLTFVRASALFMEPKNLAAFLGISFPFTIKDKNYKLAFLISLVGILTLSQTFTIFIFSFLVVFNLAKLLRNSRLIIILTVLIHMVTFIFIYSAKDSIINNTIDNKDNPIISLLIGRAIGRYDGTLIAGSMDEFAGIPFQQDLEAPIVRFIQDHPSVLLTGYGPNNSTFIPPSYFEGLWNYELQLKGTRTNHMNMRWLFYTSEIGLIFFLLIFLYLTTFNGRSFYFVYYSFLWVSFFYNEIDYVILIFYALLTCVIEKKTLKKPQVSHFHSV